MSTRPLEGLRVVVTRAAGQAAATAAAFEKAGAETALLPLIEVAPPADLQALERAAGEAPAYAWVAFTSANAVDAFLPRVEPGARERLQAAAVGPATARALARHGVEPALVAGESRAEGLAAELAPRLGTRARVLIPQADDARPELARGLAAAGAEVTAVAAYRKRLPQAARETARRLFAGAPIGWVTCTSPRIVRHLVALCAELFGDAWERRWRELEAISIGPVTSAALRRLGVEPAAEAAEPSDHGLVEAMVRASRARS